jgi:rhodanese-related sulfurtransferase
MGKTKSLKYLAVLIFTVLLSACNSNDENAISVTEFASLVESKECLLIDVRSPDEYLSGHIDGSATIDFYSPEFEHKFRFIDVNQCMLFYCSTGNRSGQAAHILKKELGFTNIVHLKDGLNAWEESGYELVED